MSEGNKYNEQQEGPDNFGVPDGYFDRSAAALMNRFSWLEEHKTWPRLQALKGRSGFVLPEGYFEQKACVMELIPYPGLRNREKKAGWSVPAGYWEEAEAITLSQVMADREPDTSFGPKQISFITPGSYFENNAIALKEALSDYEKEAKIVPFFTVRRLVFAAAASLLLAVFGFRLYDVFFGTSPKEDCGTLACVDRAELLKTRALESLETDELYELVNSGELEKKLEGEKTEKQQKNDSAQDLRQEELDELMDGI